MFNNTAESMEAWTKPTKAAFDFWVSFWPVAPVFGVEWRFAETMPRFTPRILEDAETEKAINAVTGKAIMKKAAPKPAAKAPAKPAQKVAPKAAAKAAEKPAAAKAEAPAAPVAPVEVKAEAPVTTPAPKKADGTPEGLLAKAPAKADDLKLIKGIGPGLEKQLNALGVYTFAQLAGFSEADLGWIDDNLTAFKGRCFRDDWVGQAKAKLA